MKPFASALLIAVAGLAAAAYAAPPDPSDDVARIIYGDLDKPAMLQALSPYVKPGDPLEGLRERSGLDPGLCFGSGPGVAHCRLLESGLELVVDPDGIIRLIRRSERTIDGRDYAEMSITTNVLEWNGYMRGYGN